MFLNETTINKINITGDNYNKKMWDHINPNQIEKKFGGNSKNMEDNYWPPCSNSKDYF